MLFRASARVATVAAAAAGGLALGLAFQVAADLAGAGPVSLTVGVGAVGTGMIGAPASRGVRALAACGATLLAVWQAEAVARGIGAVAPLAGPSAVLLGAAASGILLGAALGAPVRAASSTLRPVHALVAAPAFVAATWLPREALLGAWAVTALLAGTPPVVPAPSRLAPRRVLGALAVALPALMTWLTFRAALDPTMVGATAFFGAAIAGLAAPGGWAAAALGVALIAGGIAAGGSSAEPLLALGLGAGAALFAVMGLGAGLCGAGSRAGRAAAPGLLFAGLLLPSVLGALPAEFVEPHVRALAATWAGRGRVAALRESATLSWAGSGAAGGAAVRRGKDGVFLELDGALADPTSRAGEAERFAGTLAACATSGRARARVAGDDLGLVAEGLVAQRFLRIDSATPDARLSRAVATALPATAATWIHPAVRLLQVPAPLLLRAGGTADAVVEVARTPWTDARVRAPDARGFRATRATLAPGGVHVLVLGATALDEGALRHVLRAFAAAYPAASLWLPPSGADTAVLVGPREPDARLAWAGFETCIAADRPGLRALSLRSAIDVGGLAMADGAALTALADGTRPGPGLPPGVRNAPALPLAALAALTLDPARLFDGAAPADELRARGDTRRRFLEMLATATGGDVRGAIEQARTIGAAAGGGRALEPLVRPYLVRARDAVARGRREGVSSRAWEEAEAAIVSARLVYPGFAETACAEGELALALGHASRATEAYTRCAELAPDDPAGWTGMALVARARGDLIGTEQALRKAAAAAPDSWIETHRLGVLLLEVGRHDESERALKQAVALAARDGQEDAAPHLALARLYLATDQAPLALAEAGRASIVEPSASALALRGAARYEMSQLELAERDFQEALALDPRDLVALGGLGNLQARRGDLDQAAATYKAILALDPQNASARENLRRLGQRALESDR